MGTERLLLVSSYHIQRNISILLAIITLINIACTCSHASNKALLGVHPERKQFYELPKDQMFKCLDGSALVPTTFVNDDYCDCHDASDEPGTSACPHGRFYCVNEGYMPRLIPSAWVNDGQCDCCDASDEYNSTARCENECYTLGESYRKEQERLKEVSDQGSAIRSQYKAQAKQIRETNSQLLEQYRRELTEKENAIKKLEEDMNGDFGPSHIYLPLKGKCFSFKDREYTYTLCMFERATQESTSGMQTELGRWAGWTGPSDNPYKSQKYEGGMQCWNGPTRSALVNIACGVEDKVVMVTEPAKCEYVYDFETPAACPDLDPPEEQPSSPPPPVTEQQSDDGLEREFDTEPTTNYPDGQDEAPDGEGSVVPDGQHDEL